MPNKLRRDVETCSTSDLFLVSLCTSTMLYPSFATEDCIAIASSFLSVVFLLSIPWRLWQLHHAPVKVRPSRIGKIKSVSPLAQVETSALVFRV